MAAADRKVPHRQAHHAVLTRVGPESTSKAEAYAAVQSISGGRVPTI
jgi:hypothetical protein